jgi:hypothetical protein
VVVTICRFRRQENMSIPIDECGGRQLPTALAPNRRNSARAAETIRRAARTLEVAANRKFSIMKNMSHLDRLSDQIRELRARAERLPDGDERDELLRQARQDEVARRLIEWVTSDQETPPDDVIPIWRHRLHRK